MREQAKRKAVIYTRIAMRGAFADRADQEKRCSDYAAANGYIVVETFADYGSGDDAHRPGIYAMIGFLAVQDAPPPVVIIDDIARISRDIAVFDQIRESVKLNGSDIVSPSIHDEVRL